MRFSEAFSKLAHATARQSGRAPTFGVALAVVVGWAVSGPLFGWSDTWQLVINTGTTIVTFLMVFLIQNTQNRDTEAIHLKLDELIRVNRAARNSLINLEKLSDEELERVRRAMAELCETGDPASASPGAPAGADAPPATGRRHARAG